MKILLMCLLISFGFLLYQVRTPVKVLYHLEERYNKPVLQVTDYGYPFRGTQRDL